MSRRRPSVQAGFPLLLAVIAFLATVPFGATAVWSKSFICFAALLACIGSSIIASGKCPLPDPRQNRTTRTLVVLGIASLALSFFYLIPLPASFSAASTAMLPESLRPGSSGFSSLSINSAQTWLQNSHLLSLAAIGLLAAKHFHQQQQLKLIAYALVISGTIQSFAAFTQLSESWALDNPFFRRRLTGTFSGGNALAGYLSLTLSVTLGLLLNEVGSVVQRSQRNWRILLDTTNRLQRRLLLVIVIAGSLVLQTATLLLSGSRGGVLASAITILILLLAALRTPIGGLSRKSFATGLLAVLIPVTIAISGSFQTLLSRLPASPEAGLAEVDASQRLPLWKASVALAKQRPFGIGPGCYPEAISQFQPEILAPSRTRYAHNDYLQQFVEKGLLGGMLTLALAAVYLLFVRQRFKTAEGEHTWLIRGLLLAPVALLLHSITDFNLSARPGVGLTFALLVGLSFSTAMQLTSRISKAKHPARIPAVPTLFGIILMILVAVRALFVGIYDIKLQQVKSSLDLPRDIYFWLNLPAPPAPKTIPMLANDFGMHPETIYTKFNLADAFFAKKKAAALLELAETQPNLPRDIQYSVVNASFAADRHAAMTPLIPVLTEGLQNTPHRQDTAIALATLYLTQYHADELPTSLDTAVQLIQYATQLAPNDAYTHAEATHLWSQLVNSTASKSSIMESARNYTIASANRALALRIDDQDRLVFDVKQAGIPFTEILQAEYVDLGVFSAILKHYESDMTSYQLAEYYRRWIDTLQRTEIPLIAGQPSPAFKTKRENRLRAGFLAYARLLLQLNEHERYKEVHRQAIAFQRGLMDEEIASIGRNEASKRQILQSYSREIPLTLPEEVQLIRLLLSDGKAKEANAQCLHAILGPNLPNLPRSTILTDLTRIPLAEQTPLIKSLIALISSAPSRIQSALEQTISRCTTPQKLSYKHRMYLLAAYQAADQGDETLAEKLRLAAATLMPQDPDTNDISLPSFNTFHDGNHAELNYYHVRNQGEQFLVKVGVRFWTRPAHDLSLHLFLHDPKQDRSGNKQVIPVGKHRESNIVGTEQVFEVLLPEDPNFFDPVVGIGLRTAKSKTWLRTAEGLPYVLLGAAR